MPRTIDRRELLELLERLDGDGGVQLVEVLPREEFDDEHLPGAINIPLRHVEREAREILDPTRPVVVYCFDSG